MRSRKFLLTLSLLLFFCINESYSQCCSMGSPAGASTYVGVLAKNHFRFIAFYRYNYLDDYYNGAHKKEPFPATFIKNSYYNFAGITLSYGITKRLTADADFGYFINKTQVREINDTISKTRGYGLTNGGVTFKYGAFIKPLKQIELTFGLGIKYPFSGKPIMVDGVRPPIDLQPSTNGFGLSGQIIFSKGFPKLSMRLMSVNKYEYNFTNPDNYRFGSSITNSVFLSKKIVKNFFGVLQVRNEYRLMDYTTKSEKSTGGEVMWLSAQLSYSILCKWHVAGLFDYPIYKNYNGTQLTPAWSFAFSLTRDLDFNKKNPK